MRRHFVLTASGAVLALTFATSAQFSGAFPAPSSSVVGSVGFISPSEIGYFWSAARGDGVEDHFKDTGLGAVRRVDLALSVPQNALNGGNRVDWDVRLNGDTVGRFSVPEGFTGPLRLEFIFDARFESEGHWDISLRVTNNVPPGGGSHTFGVPGQATLYSVRPGDSVTRTLSEGASPAPVPQPRLLDANLGDGLAALARDGELRVEARGTPDEAMSLWVVAADGVPAYVLLDVGTCDVEGTFARTLQLPAAVAVERLTLRVMPLARTPAVGRDLVVPLRR